MKKLLLLSTFLLSSLYAHECHYKLDVNIDMDKELVYGQATITSDHPNMQLMNSKANIIDVKGATFSVALNIPVLMNRDINKSVEISFSTDFKTMNGDVLLLETWYPKVDILCTYETNIIDSNLTIVTEPSNILVNNLHLIGSNNYIKNTMQTEDNLTLSTYFYKEDANLSDTYLKKSEEYFKLYKDEFGFIPFNEFSVVEAPFPAGYSMPTFTLIGKQIIDKDFVINNSLGHEIVHQWFGNYVYSPDQGNWSEGLTTFYSDYLYSQNNHKGAHYRKHMLIKYNSYVNTNNEIALIEFKHKQVESKNAIGYGKSAFFFYMLERKIGKENFNKGIKLLLKEYPYKVASYKNLREIFEKVSDKKLLEFFKTWVYTKGALDFQISNINLMYIKNNYVLEFDLASNINSGKLPIAICSDYECLYTDIDLSQKTHTLELDIEPTKIIADAGYEVFRKLSVKEIPPVISKVLSGNAILVIDKQNEEKFSKLKHAYKNFKYADEITYKELKENNIFVVGSKNSLLKQLTIDFKMQGDTKIEVFKNPLNESKVVAVFEMEKLSRSVFYKLKHLGKYSSVVFKDGITIDKKIKKSSKGITYPINSSSSVVTPQTQNFNDMLGEITRSKVVFIGESHTSFSSHLNQLKIIKEMYKKNKKTAIAMEMFQKPYQKYLDAFIAGEITEKEMIQKTEYFDRWKYDYELYRPIILFAKEKGLPIIAMNIDRKITKQVVSDGLDSLSEEQRAQIPSSINFRDTKYKEQLQMIFSMHQSKDFKSFDEFHHAQLVWDESMAHNVVSFMKENINHSVAVLAGNGHIMYGYGIPSRMERRGVTDYTITLNMKNPAPGIADFVLYPSNVSTTKAKKIGVFLKGGETLEILSIVENSVASKVDIQAGDVIIAYNGTTVSKLSELKTELAFTDKEAVLTIQRDYENIEVEIYFSDF